MIDFSLQKRKNTRQKTLSPKGFGGGGVLRAFSVAEALMTLLIVSCLLAMCAPLFSKRANSNFALEASLIIPSGAIMYFDLESCPNGWSPLTETHPEAANAFIRNISGTAREKGSVENSAVPNITGMTNGEQSGRVTNEGAFYSTSGGVARGGDYGGNLLYFDASRVSEVYQNGVTEARPYNIGFIACRRD